ncbi:MAG: hypothetical protein L0323_19060 [Planctomycetes bacterium]|nr:hypothetical protein [Planctomycetota bacterium]
MTKEKSVEQFLAAPDSLRKSEAETRKAVLRKAAEEAERVRLRLGKMRTPPSMEDLLADIVRVASDPQTNPLFYKFRSISRRRYELYGHFPVEAVDREFGQFEHAKQVAGLVDQPGTTLWKAARAETSRREHAARYLDRCVRPYVRPAEPTLRKTFMVLSGSDFHDFFLDPWTWLCFLQAIRDLQPDMVYLNGDVIDGAEIGRYPKVPGWTMPLQAELDFCREMLRQVREVAGFQGELVLGAGNHCLDRMARYLTQVSPELSGLRSIRFDKLLDLEGLGVQLAMSGTIASPKDQEHAKRGRLLFGFYRVHHGVRLGKTPAVEELKDAGRSGQSGHVHRAGLAFGTTERDMGMSWMSTPMACVERAGRAYISATTPGWQKGFGIAFLSPDGHVHQYPVLTESGGARRCVIEGMTYECRLPAGDPDPQTMWIKDLRLPS